MVIVAVLSLLASTYFYFYKNIKSPEEIIKPVLTPDDRSEKKGDKSNDRSTIKSSPTRSTTLQYVEKRVIEGEVFQACNVSGLFLTTLYSGQSIASLGRKHGAFFNPEGEILRDHVMLLDNPLRLSMDCSLTITDNYDVQGHSSFNILIERRDK